MERIAHQVGVSHQTVRNDLRTYMSRLDQENLQAAAALRAAEFSSLQRAAELVEEELFERKDLDRIPDLVRLSEQKRRVYALDLQPVRKAEIQHKKTVVIELIHTLKARISPIAYAEVLGALAADDNYKLMGSVVTADSADGIEPPRELLEGVGSEEGVVAPSDAGHNGFGSRPPVPLVVSN